MKTRQEKSIITLIHKDNSLTDFQKEVLTEALKIPKGRVVTYKDIAKEIGKPKAYRAVANALGRNPFSPKVPCHRVIKSDNSIGGFSAKGGIEAKKRMLVAEGLTIKDNVVIMRNTK